MIGEFGEQKMADLLAALGNGISIQSAVPLVYEMTLEELENEWRSSIGADLFVAPTATPTSSVPTPTPTRNALLPLTLDQVAEAGRVTPPPEPQATATAEALEDVVTPTPLPQLEETPESEATGGSCSATHGGPAQATPLLGVTSVLLLAAWRTVRRREEANGS